MNQMNHTPTQTLPAVTAEMTAAGLQLAPAQNAPVPDAFLNLANHLGLVPMTILRPDMAPYVEGSIAGFPPDEAFRLYMLQAARPANVPHVELPKVSEPAPQPNSDVVIPENWRDLHHLQRVRLAKQVAGLSDEVKITKEDADDILARATNQRGESNGIGDEERDAAGGP